MEQTLFKQLYESHARALLLYARQFSGSHAEAEDAVQEGFLKVFGARRDPPDAEIVPWLYKAVRWAALDQVRKRTRRQQRENEHAEFHRQDAWFEPKLESDVRRLEIERLVAALPGDQREILILKIWGGLSFREIGQALDIPINTAASRYRYALQRLREWLKDGNANDSI